jgi:hypothetical protein
MKKTLCGFVITCVISAFPVAAQNTAVVIANAEMQAKLKDMIEKKVQDDSVRVASAGDANVGVFFIHLNPGQTPQEPIQLMSHDVTEVYYVIKGEGTLYHGGTIENPATRDLATTGGRTTPAVVASYGLWFGCARFTEPAIDLGHRTGGLLGNKRT